MNVPRAELSPYGFCELVYEKKRPFLRINLIGLKSNHDHAIVDDTGLYLAVFTSDSSGGAHESMSITTRAGHTLSGSSVLLEAYGKILARGTFE